MNQKNDDMQKVTNRLSEFFQLRDQAAGGDILIGDLEARIANIRAMRARLEHRQEQITAELAPRFAEVGPISFRHDGCNFVVLHIADEPRLTVDTLSGVADLAKACQPRTHADETIIEAARFAAVNGEFPRPDEDEFTGEYDDSITLSDGDSIRLPFQDYIARNGGRTATIANGVAVVDQEAG